MLISAFLEAQEPSLGRYGTIVKREEHKSGGCQEEFKERRMKKGKLGVGFPDIYLCKE